MDGMEMTGTPWLPAGPPMLHAYREYECSQNTTAECDYYQEYWHFWYESDHRFALPTVALFTTTIILFALAHFFQRSAPRSVQETSIIRRKTALYRFLSYRSFRLPALNWNSAPLGVLLLGLVGTIFFLCMTLIPQPYYWPESATLNYWGGSPPIATRSGWLSLGCMPFVFLTAGKSNLITAVTGVSHEKLQVYHRWISYAFFVTALVHTFPFIVYNIKTGQMVMQWMTNFDYWTGVVALIAQAYLTFASMGPLRNMSYEWFKFSHFVAALVFMIFLFVHCASTLSSWDYFIVTGVFFTFSWLHRQLRVYFEHGLHRDATISLAANGFVRVVIPTKAIWQVGQHFFVRFLSADIHALSIHPFTACSLPSATGPDSELVLYIRPQKGFTARLARQAASAPGSKVRLLLDGPYGGVHMQKVQQCQRQIIIAGGSGSGWILPFILASLYTSGSTDKKFESRDNTLRIIVATRDIVARQWFDQTVRELLSSMGLNKLPPNIEIEEFFTGSDTMSAMTRVSDKVPYASEDPEKAFGTAHVSSRDGSDSDAESTDGKSSKQLSGRPDLPTLLREEFTSATAPERIGVFVCGPLSMQNDVSNTVAKAQVEILKGRRKDIYLHMEHFSWA
ncbi:hypothetical protein B0A48_11947 [Cryoendolithus antarcticus]|uniref:FAD-binding FR-type domain-containing protein n=1 Tax=Cryoendolithus antarcticus TaxID=1507870 RepID=A0A1V8STN2_9PEZI|nr:hypothetical protein B0A48_11947 [Cryoendolithus antarcticus]